MQLPNLEEMSEAEKTWFAHSIAGMVVADGHTDQSEMNFLREAINFFARQRRNQQYHDCDQRG